MPERFKELSREWIFIPVMPEMAPASGLGQKTLHGRTTSGSLHFLQNAFNRQQAIAIFSIVVAHFRSGAPILAFFAVRRTTL
jgi:hypothetical protein